MQKRKKKEKRLLIASNLADTLPALNNKSIKTMLLFFRFRVMAQSFQKNLVFLLRLIKAIPTSNATNHGIILSTDDEKAQSQLLLLLKFFTVSFLVSVTRSTSTW